MVEQVELRCENTGQLECCAVGSTLLEVSRRQQVQLPSPILAALVDNQLKSLSYKVYNPKTVRFIDISHPDGMRTYQRSLEFLLHKAVKDTLPSRRLRIRNSISNGLYYEVSDGKHPL